MGAYFFGVLVPLDGLRLLGVGVLIAPRLLVQLVKALAPGAEGRFGDKTRCHHGDAGNAVKPTVPDFSSFSETAREVVAEFRTS